MVTVLWTLTPLILSAGPPGLRLSVVSGEWERRDSPVIVSVPREQWRGALTADAGEVVELREVGSGTPGGRMIPVEVDQTAQAADGAANDQVRITFVLDGVTPAGARREFELRVVATGGDRRSPWSFREESDGSILLLNRDKPVFRYNLQPTHHPAYPTLQDRGAYIHPAFTPSGHVITGDYSRAHTHHRGIFLAYAKTHVGDRQIDFWNLHRDAARIRGVGVEAKHTGPVTARFEARHEWTHPEGPVVLRERWRVEAYDIPESPYWLFDLTSTQEAVDAAVELVPHRYGGIAYRGPDSFLPPALLDVRTSEGLDRRAGDQKPARWVDLTGPVRGGSSIYGGAMIADHPSNHGHPTVARIHPTTLPFFSYVPAYRTASTLAPGRPVTFRYRVLIHDGRPDVELDERIFRDFAEPPRVTPQGLKR
jgi:hypothetical protein